MPDFLTAIIDALLTPTRSWRPQYRSKIRSTRRAKADRRAKKPSTRKRKRQWNRNQKPSASCDASPSSRKLCADRAARNGAAIVNTSRSVRMSVRDANRLVAPWARRPLTQLARPASEPHCK